MQKWTSVVFPPFCSNIFDFLKTFFFTISFRIQGIAARLSNLATDSSATVMKSDMMPFSMSDQMVAAILYANGYINYHFMKLVNAELTYFNCEFLVLN